MGKNYWMVVQTHENFNITKENGFGLLGLRARHRRRAQRMQPDDRVLFYITGLRIWSAITTITSSYFESRDRIWNPVPPREQFPYRVKMKPALVLDEDDYIDALELGPRLEYVKRWLPEDWPLAFFDTLHLIPQRDFRLIEAEMKRILSRHRKAKDGDRPMGERGGSVDGVSESKMAQEDIEAQPVSNQSDAEVQQAEDQDDIPAQPAGDGSADST